LNQLLGGGVSNSKDGNDDVRARQQFVDEVRRFKRGEPLTQFASAARTLSASSPLPKKATALPPSSSKNPPASIAQTSIIRKLSADLPPPTPPSSSATHTKSSTAAATKNEIRREQKQDTKSSSKSKGGRTTTPSTTNISKKKTQNKPQPKGKAAVVCGCFGSMHKPYANCLHCGRIACEKEKGAGGVAANDGDRNKSNNITFCGFCGYLVEEAKPPSEEDEKEYVASSRCAFRSSSTIASRVVFAKYVPKTHRSSIVFVVHFSVSVSWATLSITGKQRSALGCLAVEGEHGVERSAERSANAYH